MGSAAVIHEKQVLPLNLSGRIPELDGIRGIAIRMVLIAHFFLVVSRPGSGLAYALVPLRLDWSGVDLFFVLSGFLIGGILLDARESSNYFRVFYTRRFFRIVPIYAVLLLSANFIRQVVSILFCRFSWVYFEKPPVKMGHRTSYQFGAPRLARTAPTPAEGS